MTMKLHLKGYLLVELSHRQKMWDYELIQLAMREYRLEGRAMIQSLGIALDELASGGLLKRVGSKLDDEGRLFPGRVLFCYELSDFGRQRMVDTGLLEAAGRRAT